MVDKRLESPQKDNSNEAVDSKLLASAGLFDGRLQTADNNKNASPHIEVSQDSQKPPAPNGSSDLSSRFPVMPGLNAYAARFAYFGITGKLTVDNARIREVLKNAGEPGETLLARWDELEKTGWTVGRMRFNDPWLKAEYPNPIKRFGRYLTLGGYHIDLYKGEEMRRIAYNHVISVVGGAMGTNNNPAVESATKIAHELGHHNLTPIDYRDMSKLTEAERQIVAKRLLFEETSALWSQLWVGEKNGLKGVHMDGFEPAFLNERGGSTIKRLWANAEPVYGSFKSVTPDEADAFVKQLTRKLSSDGLGMFKDGKLQPPDFSKINRFGQKIGTLSEDAAQIAKFSEPARPIEPERGILTKLLGSPENARLGGRALAALGAIGIAATVTEVGGQFKKSPGCGAGRLARVGLDWLSFDAGMYAASALGRLVFYRAGRIAALAVPFVGLSGGFIASSYADGYKGQWLEKLVKEEIDGKTK